MGDEKCKFRVEWVGIGNESIRCWLYMFDVDVVDWSEVKIVDMNVGMVGVWGRRFWCRWRRIEIKERRIVRKGGYEREGLFVYGIKKCSCREVRMWKNEG